jgi:eukaryotic-like serine/threonine-protein kinase
MSQPSASQRVIRFGTFEANLAARELRKNGVKLRLQEQPFQVLSVLLENPDQVVTREELRQGLWPADTFVDFDNGLNTAINKIREALGDSAESPRFIETIPRRGYRFVAPVQAPLAEQTHLPPAHLQSIREKIGWLGAAAVMLVLAGVSGYFYFHRTPKLTDKDSIVLADFTNTTGDPVFDGALRQGLSVQLEQTPFLRVISGDQLTQTLKMMEQPDDAKLTPALAREVCQRANATVEIEGSIAALGNQYVLGLNAVNCATGETLAGEQVTADRKEKVLSTLNDAASELRSKLGESRASLKTYDVPVEQATTSSLEALQVYSQSRQAFSKSDFPSAISSFQRAVDLDPNFATAYAGLGVTYGTISDNGLAAKNIQRAYDLRSRTSEYERLGISATYNYFVTRDFEKAAQVYDQLTKTYPRDAGGWTGLANSADALGRFDQAVAAALKAVELSPSSWAYGQASYFYIHQDHFKEARAMFEEARSRKIEPFGLSSGLYALAFLDNDQAGMAEQVAHPWTDTPPGFREDVQGATAAYRGRLALARDWTRRAIASAMSAQLRDQAAGYTVESALREALLGNFGEAQKEAEEARRLSPDGDVQGGAALTLALSSDPAEAEKVAHNLSEHFADATIVRFYHLPAIHAALALQQGDPHRANESLNIASSYELAYPGFCGPPMMPVYVRGEGYLAAHQGVEAAAEFQKILDHPGLVGKVPMSGLVGNAPIGALAHLGLGRAYAVAGDTAKAKAAYEDFLTLWKDADPDIPIFKQAKAEYAKLK